MIVAQIDTPDCAANTPSYTFTVFTTTYNRAHTLPRVYDSLKAQTFRDFEWLVLNNGSTDQTHELIQQWQQENLFPIRYLHNPINQGIHIAINQGVQAANSEFFLIFDSDDACTPEALERFKYHWNTIPLEQSNRFVGVTALSRDQYGNLCGDLFPSNPMDSNSIEIQYRYHNHGENWGFQRLDVLRQFLLPEDVDGVHVPLNLIWHQIARKYQTRYVNEVLSTYWTDQPSVTRNKDVTHSANGLSLYHQMVLNEELDWFFVNPRIFLVSATHYSRFSFHSKRSMGWQWAGLTSIASRLLWLTFLPVGYAVYLKDKFRSQPA